MSLYKEKLREFGFNPGYPGNPFATYVDTDELKSKDVPNVVDNEEFITHVPINSEQTAPEDEIPSEDNPITQDPNSMYSQDPNSMVDPNSAYSQDPNSMVDPNSMYPQDPNAQPEMMAPVIPGPTSAKEVGRIYEIKKIHSRLISIDSYLATSNDPSLIKLKNYVSEALQLFLVLISNLTFFKEYIDDVIIIFYKFIDEIYSSLSKYYNDNKKNEFKY